MGDRRNRRSNPGCVWLVVRSDGNQGYTNMVKHKHRAGHLLTPHLTVPGQIIVLLRAIFTNLIGSWLESTLWELWRRIKVSQRDPSQLSGSRRSGEIPLSSVPAVEESASWWQCGSEFSYRLLSRSSWGDGLPRCWSLSGNCCFHVSRWLRSIYHIDLMLDIDIDIHHRKHETEI